MKIASILFMLLGIFMIFSAGALYLLGFAMSFDAPGSSSDPKAWMMRLLIFSPIVVLFILLIFAFLAFRAGKFKRSFLISLLFPVSGIAAVIAMSVSTANTYNDYKETTTRQEAEWAEEARLYPSQQFLRSIGQDTDTIIVNSSRTVIFQQHKGPVIRYAGPIAVLNTTRDTLVFYDHTTVITPEELNQFADENDRKLSDVYFIK